jgi:hypothetical protein
MRLRSIVLGLGAMVAAGVAAPAAGQAPAVAPSAPAPDYRKAADWLCRPGKESLCVTQLDAVRVEGGATQAEPFKAATDAPVDCFYVYPTVSRDPTPFSDLQPGPEEFGVVKAQAARFSSRCRVFAPLYRQVTLAGLNASMRGGAQTDWAPAYQDVLAAWKDYLAHDNKGRGVLLIGHSQGSIMLGRLIAEEIEGKPVQQQVVAAYLAGHPQITVPTGSAVGGTFKVMPLCRSNAQIGCILAWSSYDGSAMPSARVFQPAPDPGLESVCTNPAALGGGKALLDAYVARPRGAAESDPPFVHDIGGFSGECVSDEKGAALAVSVTPGPGDAQRQALLTATSSRSPSWGLHTLDISLAEGTLLTLADRQIAAYRAEAQ